MAITKLELAKIIDATSMANTATKADMDELVALCKKYGFGHAVGIQCYIPYLIDQLRGTQTKVVGAAGGRGSDDLVDCIPQALANIGLGCGEIESRMSLNFFRSGMYDEIVKATRAIKNAVGDIVYKVIIEAPVLTDDEIRTACDLIVDGGADYIKSATGTMGATTVHHIEVMSAANKGRAKLKAAGGIRTIETIESMLDLGVTRFGIGLKSAVAILDGMQA